jgi:hypothetical protein
MWEHIRRPYPQKHAEQPFWGFCSAPVRLLRESSARTARALDDGRIRIRRLIRKEGFQRRHVHKDAAAKLSRFDPASGKQPDYGTLRDRQEPGRFDGRHSKAFKQ